MKTAKAKTVSQPWDMEIKRNIRARLKTEIVSVATGAAVKTSDWVENLALDTALDYLVSGGTNSSDELFKHLKIGSGTNPNSFASGALTFTQAFNTITASGVFFTAAMVGGIFKYGTGSAGAEQYIATVAGGGLSCTVTGAGMTVVVPTVGTVWQVQQTTLQTYLALDTGYQTNAGDNSTTLAGGTITMQRTFLFATPGATQHINELSYTDANTNDGLYIKGRIVLPSTDVVDTSHYYRVIMQMVLTVSPSAPTAVPDVGTNIVTAGTTMFEYYDFYAIQANGGHVNYQGSVGGQGYLFMDGGTNEPLIYLRTNNWSQPGAIQTGANAANPGDTYNFDPNVFSKAGQPLGVAVSTSNFSFTTSGETLYGIGVTGNGGLTVWTLKFTTPVTLPTGTFQGNMSIQKVFTRTLTN
jgi:hypothetical protein